MRKVWILLAVLLASLNATEAQTKSMLSSNLVFNPSFEEYRECPRRIDALGTLTIVDAWYQPTAGSADYYNVCGSRECSVPKNKLGIQEPHSGVGYCGIYCSKTDYREYLQTQLKEPLKANEMYRISFYVSLSEYSSGSVATIGALFTQNRVNDTVRSVLMRKEVRNIGSGISQTVASYFEPQVVNDYNHVLTDTKGWTLVSGTFVAQGGEQFLTIGNFFPASQSNVVDLDSLTYLLPGAYYYIDDVSLVCLGCTEDAQPDTVDSVVTDAPGKTINEFTISPDSLQVGSTFVLHNIFFDYDKSTLLQQSYNELQQLLALLKEYPEMRIEVRGHTDGRGSVDYNNRLSENRAKAVVDFLVSKGVDQRRLQYKGFGKSMPIDSNATEAGRARNRRVEFRILSM
ncbi:MAG: OmpA family protein [Bacteroidales bacterium]|nr:OmpA family protein [Bacteroidales bacterium]